MCQLSFDYDSRANESIAYHGGDDETAPYRVRMIQDDSPENPFKSWDGHWPMIVDYRDRGHNFTEYDKAPGASVDDPLARFSDWQLIRYQAAICEALGDDCAHHCWPARSIESDLAEYKHDYRAEYVKGRAGMAALLLDYFREALGNVSDSDKLECLSSLYDIIGIPNLCTSSHGYSQGDYAELLIVATPEAASQFGWKAKRPMEAVKADMEAQAALYSAWAWGDVYGYIVERAPHDPEEREDSDAWEEIDSCWGFYGDDPDQSGLAEQALDAIEYDIRRRKEARLAKLKELLRAKVPLEARQSILAELA